MPMCSNYKSSIKVILILLTIFCFAYFILLMLGVQNLRGNYVVVALDKSNTVSNVMFYQSHSNSFTTFPTYHEFHIVEANNGTDVWQFVMSKKDRDCPQKIRRISSSKVIYGTINECMKEIISPAKITKNVKYLILSGYVPNKNHENVWFIVSNCDNATDKTCLETNSPASILSKYRGK